MEVSPQTSMNMTGRMGNKFKIILRGLGHTFQLIVSGPKVQQNAINHNLFSFPQWWRKIPLSVKNVASVLS